MEEKELNPNPAKEKDNEDYIEAIKKLKEEKANMVSKEDFEKIKEQNRQLLQSLVDDQKVKVEPQADIDKAMKDQQQKLFNRDGSVTNLEYWKNALAYRKNRLEHDGIDIFEPKGHEIQVNQLDKQSIENVINGIQYCIDFSEGDSGVFTAKLQSILK